MKGYFIHYNARDTIGVSRKIDMQLKEFSKRYNVEELDIKMSTKNFFVNALSVLPFFSICWDYRHAYEAIESPDFIYIRKAGGDRKHYKFLKYIKSRYPKCKILVEIPTYPYWKESLQSLTGILLIKDYFNYRLILNKYIDRIVTYSADDEIFGVQTIRVKNGINVQSIPQTKNVRSEKESITLLAVAVLKPHHGYERILNGLAEYRRRGGNRKVFFVIVGDGPEKSYYEKVTRELKLNDIVSFCGMKSGAKLQEIYDRADIAVSALGFYKDKVTKSSALKVREYLAEGLPVISGCREDAFDDTDGKFCCSFPNDKSYIDIERVVRFYDDLLKQYTRNELTEEVRRFAYEHVDNSITMKPIFEYIEEKILIAHDTE